MRATAAKSQQYVSLLSAINQAQPESSTVMPPIGDRGTNRRRGTQGGVSLPPEGRCSNPGVGKHKEHLKVPGGSRAGEKGFRKTALRSPQSDKDLGGAESEDQPSPKTFHNFLTKYSGMYKRPQAPPVTDLEVWRRRNNVTGNGKVFIIQGGYDDIRQALVRRGWVENPEVTSVCFNLKWALKSKDVDYSNLLDYQVVNHFDQNSNLTTKIGLCHSLRKLVWFNSVDTDRFYPRCYDLVQSNDISDFLEEFKNVRAESVIKRFVMGGHRVSPLEEMRLLVALNICQRRVRDPDEALDDPEAGESAVTEEEWEVLRSEVMGKDAVIVKGKELWYRRILKRFNLKREEGKKGMEAPKREDVGKRADEVLREMRLKFAQYDLNGHRNLWIVKPAGLSRGRGIKIFDSVSEIMEYAHCREQQFVVQKYMENPMIILNRKFDIRQWVLVTSLNPLTIWFYAECYIRFGAVEYKIQDFNNKFMHLTNNSVTKHYEGENQEIEGNMWEQKEFAEFLQVCAADIMHCRIGKVQGGLVLHKNPADDEADRHLESRVRPGLRC